MAIIFPVALAATPVHPPNIATRWTLYSNLQPYIVTGNYITAGFGAAAAATVLVIRHFYNKDLKQKQILKM
ncbi:major facilitator superfamily transporter [Colletotrichum tofieldiae]|nr:major facilitator superfamily transporter [Colletotrichum tofieldiae]GKT77476.1 major facilitator superfamily transporter [Colletotrichum tofieldiae]